MAERGENLSHTGKEQFLDLTFGYEHNFLGMSIDGEQRSATNLLKTAALAVRTVGVDTNESSRAKLLLADGLTAHFGPVSHDLQRTIDALGADAELSPRQIKLIKLANIVVRAASRFAMDGEGLPPIQVKPLLSEPQEGKEPEELKGSAADYYRHAQQAVGEIHQLEDAFALLDANAYETDTQGLGEALMEFMADELEVRLEGNTYAERKQGFIAATNALAENDTIDDEHITGDIALHPDTARALSTISRLKIESDARAQIEEDMLKAVRNAMEVTTSSESAFAAVADNSDLRTLIAREAARQLDIKPGNFTSFTGEDLAQDGSVRKDAVPEWSEYMIASSLLQGVQRIIPKLRLTDEDTKKYLALSDMDAFREKRYGTIAMNQNNRLQLFVDERRQLLDAVLITYATPDVTSFDFGGHEVSVADARQSFLSLAGELINNGWLQVDHPENVEEKVLLGALKTRLQETSRQIHMDRETAEVLNVMATINQDDFHISVASQIKKLIAQAEAQGVFFGKGTTDQKEDFLWVKIGQDQLAWPIKFMTSSGTHIRKPLKALNNQALLTHIDQKLSHGIPSVILLEEDIYGETFLRVRYHNGEVEHIPFKIEPQVVLPS